MALGVFLWGSALSSCSEESAYDDAEDSGFVTLDMQLDANPVGAELSRADDSRISLSSLLLTLTDKDRKKVTTHSVDDFADAKEIRTGAYMLEATFGTKGEEGWGKLFCYGLQEFRVRLGKVTEVSMPVTMANSMVEINYSEAFSQYLTDVTTSVVTEAGNLFDWSGDHTDDLYISPGTFSVSVSFTKPNGKSATAVVGPYTAEAKHQYAVNLDVDYASAEKIVLTIDDTLTEKEETIDISDENLPTLMAAPEMTISEGYRLGQTIPHVEYDRPVTPLTTTVMARGRIASAILTTESPDLVEEGFPASVDLCNPGAAADKLIEMGLESRGFSGTGGVFGTIDFTRLLSNITYRDNGTNVSTFRLTIADTHGNEVTRKLFSVSLTQLEISVPAQGQLTGEGSANISVECNSASPEFEVKARSAESGIWVPLTVGSVTRSGSNPDNGNVIYTLTLSGDELTYDRQIPVRIYVADQRRFTEDFIRVPSTRIEPSKTNAFAKSAYLTVAMTTDEAAAEADKVTFEVSTNGSTFTPATASLVSAPGSATAGQRGVYRITGLNPSVKYTVRSIHDGEKSRTATFTTEEAKPLTNAGLEESNEEDSGGVLSNVYWREYSFNGWATNNYMTTHGGGANYKYVKNSGTEPSDNGRTNKCAVLRTVGWGSGNTAAAISGFGTCHYVTPGELFLGTSGYNNQTPDNSYGIDFASRPSALKFYYKYFTVSSDNGDYATAEITIRDSSGNVITAKKNLTAHSDWEPETLSLDYPLTASKAVQISVAFKSSGNSNCWKAESKYMTPPPARNLSTGEYLGSQLYIDDIELIYE